MRLIVSLGTVLTLKNAMNYKERFNQALKVNKWPVMSVKEQEKEARKELLSVLTGKKMK